jgi:hypothetical protein
LRLSHTFTQNHQHHRHHRVVADDCDVHDDHAVPDDDEVVKVGHNCCARVMLTKAIDSEVGGAEKADRK